MDIANDASIEEIRLQKTQRLRELGIDPYPYHFDQIHKAKGLQEHYKDLENDQLTEDEVQVAGRIMAIRNSGMFIVLDDTTDRIQIFCQRETLSAQDVECLDLLDLGDWIGIHGKIRRTKRGELTINASKITILAKTLLPLPEKYHGLTDIEMRYRQRYLDLIMNLDSRNRLRLRSHIIATLRRLLIERGFLEVETPMLHVIPGGAAAKPFVTHHNSLGLDMYLRIAPELFLKRLIVGGLSDRVFEINRCFRNEGLSPRHNPEFTSVELYQAFADYHDMMDLTEDLISSIAQHVLGTTTVTYNGVELNFGNPWPRKSMIQLVHEATGVDFSQIATDAEARDAAKKLNIHVKPTNNWGEVIEVIFGEKVEPTLIQPIHVTDLPKDISPLAKVHRTDPRLTERFETYANTWELANAFSELNDPVDQRQRFEEQVKAKDQGNDEAHEMDEDFITALEYGMPPTGGLGIGLDRLCMLLTDGHSIRDVIAFPTMKPKR